jgi:hypothetical protein
MVHSLRRRPHLLGPRRPDRPGLLGGPVPGGPAPHVVFGLWGVAIILLAAALLALWATRYPLSPTWLRVARVAAALVAIALLLRGVYVELALATDLGGVRQTVGPLETHWSLTLWNPWFILGAFCFFALSVAIKAKANHGEKKAVGEN